MLIGICGSLCAGKSTVAKYLVECHGFTRIYIREGAAAVEASTTTTTVPPPTVFPSAQALLDFVTTRWRDRWVTTDVASEATLDVLSCRPFFLLISVDAPLAVRWRRAQRRALSRGRAAQDDTAALAGPLAGDVGTPGIRNAGLAAPPTLDAFVVQSDRELYGSGDPQHPPLLPVMARSAMRLVNGADGLVGLVGSLGLKGSAASSARSAASASPSAPSAPSVQSGVPMTPLAAAADPATAALYAALQQAGLTAAGVEQLLRPSWDRYFMALASLAAQRSNCMKRRVGCVLVREHRVVSTGYNGTPRGLRNCGEGGCGRCNHGGAAAGVGLATCLCLHAEENALLEAGRERIPTVSLDRTILYCDTCPCLTCSIKIVQVGIGEVVYAQGYSMDAATAAVFREAGVRLRQFVPPAQGLIHLEKIELS